MLNCDLLERLRRESRFQLGEHSIAMHDAADEIERLMKRIGELKDERNLYALRCGVEIVDTKGD